MAKTGGKQQMVKHDMLTLEATLNVGQRDIHADIEKDFGDLASRKVQTEVCLTSCQVFSGYRNIIL